MIPFISIREKISQPNAHDAFVFILEPILATDIDIMRAAIRNRTAQVKNVTSVNILISLVLGKDKHFMSVEIPSHFPSIIQNSNSMFHRMSNMGFYYFWN